MNQHKPDCSIKHIPIDVASCCCGMTPKTEGDEETGTSSDRGDAVKTALKVLKDLAHPSAEALPDGVHLTALVTGVNQLFPLLEDYFAAERQRGEAARDAHWYRFLLEKEAAMSQSGINSEYETGYFEAIDDMAKLLNPTKK